MSFGGVAVDQVGPTRRFPAASALTGLIGNALGLDWSDRAAHQNLQERLIFASALIREGHLLTDSQNAQLSKTDKGWTTRGMPEGRDGASYGAPHRRRRDYLADAELRVVLRLTEGRPDLDMLAEALNRPARPLFIGRKPCLPSRPMLGKTPDRFVAATAHAALLASGAAGCAAEWPEGEGPAAGQGGTAPLPCPISATGAPACVAAAAPSVRSNCPVLRHEPVPDQPAAATLGAGALGRRTRLDPPARR